MKPPAQSPAQTILCRRERGRTRSQTALETRRRGQLLHPPSATVMGFFLNLLFFRLCLVLGCFISSQAAEAVCGLHFLDFFCPLHTPQPCALLSPFYDVLARSVFFSCSAGIKVSLLLLIPEGSTGEGSTHCGAFAAARSRRGPCRRGGGGGGCATSPAFPARLAASPQASPPSKGCWEVFVGGEGLGCFFFC